MSSKFFAKVRKKSVEIQDEENTKDDKITKKYRKLFLKSIKERIMAAAGGGQYKIELSSHMLANSRKSVHGEFDELKGLHLIDDVSYVSGILLKGGFKTEVTGDKVHEKLIIDWSTKW